MSGTQPSAPAPSDPLGDPPAAERGRWDSPQGNVTGLGIIASYTPKFWGIVVVIGACSGLGASALVGLLRLVERLTYGGGHLTLLGAVQAAPASRRIVALAIAAVLVTVSLKLLGRRPSGGTEVTEAIWLKSGKLDFMHSVSRGVLSIVIVGMGVSLGREAAPQVTGAALGSKLSEWAELPVWQRRLLVASGAGAGFAAVYNVPLGGTLLAMEVMLGSLALALVLPALLCSVTATAVAWIFLGNHPLYYVANERFQPGLLVFAIVIGPIIGIVATGWTRLIGYANRRRPKGVGRWFAPFGAFMLLALISLQYPQLLGNGRGIVQLSIIGSLSLGVMLMLLLLKPLVTAACLASGAPGGLFTPTLAVGVLLAGAAGQLWEHIWPGSLVGTYALIGGAAFLAAAMQGPLSGAVLALELTNHFTGMMVPMLVAVVEATVLSRRLGAASIYSARLASGDAMESSPIANAASIATIYTLDEAESPDFSRLPGDSAPPSRGLQP